MFQINLADKEENEDDDDISSKTSSALSTTTSSSSYTSSSSSYSLTSEPFVVSSVTNNVCAKQHSETILNGLKSLKCNRILCDVTLIAESKFIVFVLDLLKNVC